MTPPANPGIGCAVLGAEKLPATAGSAEAICDRIRSSIAAKSSASGLSVAVQVHTPTFISAAVTMPDGSVLPEQKVAVSDSNLNQGSIAMLAEALAKQIAAAVRK
jgi:hypothetical protein